MGLAAVGDLDQRFPGGVQSRDVASIYKCLLLQLKWKYLQGNIPNSGYLMVPIERNLMGSFLPMLLGKEDINNGMREILGHIIKYDGMGILYP